MSYGAEGRSRWYNWSRRQQAKAVARAIERCGVRKWSSLQSSDILEIGPGAGEMLPIWRDWGSTVGTQDIGTSRPDSDVHWVMSLPSVARGPWDLVYAAHVLEHLPTHGYVLESAANVAKNLAFNGLFVIQVPDLNRWGADFWDVDVTHGVPFTRRRVRQLAERSGLRIEYMTLVTGPVVGWLAYVISTAWRLFFVKAFLGFVPELAARVRRAGYSLNGDLLVVMRKV